MKTIIAALLLTAAAHAQQPFEIQSLLGRLQTVDDACVRRVEHYRAGSQKAYENAVKVSESDYKARADDAQKKGLPAASVAHGDSQACARSQRPEDGVCSQEPGLPATLDEVKGKRKFVEAKRYLESLQH